MKIYAVLVIYNQHLSDCPSFYSASKESDVQLLVVDNSTDELFQNQEEARRAGAWFLSMDGNQGLAKAYNAAFDFLRCKNGDWVVLLDDDTEIPKEYWKELQKAKPDSIQLPIVKTIREQMISPAEIRFDLPRPAKELNAIKEITGINSGMAIPKNLTDSYRYDERLFLDFIDHQFLKDMKNKGIKICILPVQLRQRFSADQPEKSAALVRLQIQMHDLSVYYQYAPWKYWYLVRKRKIRRALQLRSPEVLWYG